MVDPWYLDSCITVFSSSGTDPLALFVEQVVSEEHRWPLQFSRLPSCIGLLSSVWSSVFARLLRSRHASLAVLSASAFVLSRRLLRPHLEAMSSAAPVVEPSSAAASATPSTPTRRPMALEASPTPRTFQSFMGHLDAGGALSPANVHESPYTQRLKRSVLNQLNISFL